MRVTEAPTEIRPPVLQLHIYHEMVSLRIAKSLGGHNLVKMRLLTTPLDVPPSTWIPLKNLAGHIPRLAICVFLSSILARGVEPQAFRAPYH